MDTCRWPRSPFGRPDGVQQQQCYPKTTKTKTTTTLLDSCPNRKLKKLDRILHPCHHTFRPPSPVTQIFLIFLFMLLLYGPDTGLSSTGDGSHITSAMALQTSPSLSQHSQQNMNRNSGQFTIAQLCLGGSRFPETKRLEGAVLSSEADANINCSITFRTKSTTQRFVARFEKLNLSCDDHLKMFDGDIDYGQPSIKDFSCRDNLAHVPVIKTTGTYLTLRFSSDARTNPGDGFRLVITAIFDDSLWEQCPPEYVLCHSRLCISRSLFCDQVNHCIDNSDETGCSYDATSLPGLLHESLLSNALGLLVVLVLIIFTCVILFISYIYCRREGHYFNQYQHQLQQTIQVPLQTSSSLMFAPGHPNQFHHQQLIQQQLQQQQQQQPLQHYQYFHPAPNFNPYIQPQHHALAVYNC